jgi:hypothetical protein
MIQAIRTRLRILLIVFLFVMAGGISGFMIVEKKSFVLTEELAYRSDTACLPSSDIGHLSRDVKRVYHLIVGEWLSYMRHLKKNYPFLFSLAMRINPMDRSACAVIPDFVGQDKPA